MNQNTFNNILYSNPVKTIKDLQKLIKINNDLVNIYNESDRYIKQVTENDYFMYKINYKLLVQINENLEYFFNLMVDENNKSKESATPTQTSTPIQPPKPSTKPPKQSVPKTNKEIIDKSINYYIKKFNYNIIVNNYVKKEGIDIVVNKELMPSVKIDEIKIRKNIIVPIKKSGITSINDPKDISYLLNEYNNDIRYAQRYDLNAVLTDYINNNFNINSVNYTYLITTFYNKLIDKLPDDIRNNIKLIYKGGNVMKNIYETLKSNNLLDEKLVHFVNDRFNKSDFDFEIKISPNNIELYNKYYDYSVKIVLFIINSIKEILVYNDTLFFDIANKFDIHKNNIIKKLNDGIDTLKINNRNIYNIDKITNIEIDYDTNNFLYTFDEDNKKDNKVNKIVNIIIDKNKSPYYYYLNEIICFSNNILRNNDFTTFILGRVKYSFKITYNKINNTDSHTMKLQSEIFDLSISRYNDYKKAETDRTLGDKDNINIYYKNDSELGKIKYDSYTIDLLLNDFMQQFNEYKYMWIINKYEKKLNRYLFFINMKLSNNKNESDYVQTINKIKDLLKDLLNLTINNGLLNELKNENTDKIIFQFIDYINKIFNLVITDDNENKNKFKEFINFIITFFNNSGYVKFKIPEKEFELSYMKKY